MSFAWCRGSLASMRLAGQMYARAMAMRLSTATPQLVDISAESSVPGSQATPAADTLQRARVGWVGVGNMGMAMAKNLIRQGFQLHVFDRNPSAVTGLCQHGAIAHDSPAAVAAVPGLACLISMLPSSEHVLEVYCGKEGVLFAHGGVQPALLIDSSTIDPVTAREVAAATEAANLHPDSTPLPGGRSSPSLIDAPVSGGVPGAETATLTFMCGGHRQAVAAAQPYLSIMGKRSVYCGPPGSGQAAKVCNNLVLAISMAGVAEGLALGERLGLDPRLLSDIFNTSSARCWSSDSYNPCPGVMDGVPASRGYKGGFATKLMHKDLCLASSAADAVGSPLPMGHKALELYKQVMDKGPDAGLLDFGAVFKEVYGLGERPIK